MRTLVAITIILLGAHPARLLAQAIPAAGEEGTHAVSPASPGTAASRTPLTPQTSAGRTGANRAPSGLSSPWTAVGSLAVVLAVFFVIVWVLRRASPRGSGVLPPEAFEVLGRAPLANHQQAQLLRCGNRLLLIAVNVAGAETLAEITDPAEVERLAALCRRARPSGSALGQVFQRREKHDA